MKQAAMMTGVRHVEIQDLPDDPPIGADGIRVRTMLSGISAGTDLTFYRGTNPYLTKRWDPEYRLFFPNPGAADAFPRLVGYENVGEVVEVGSAVTEFAVGDVVFSTVGHVTEFNSTSQVSFVLPAGVAPRQGIFYALLLVAVNAILDAEILPGETVAVFGMGVIGNMTVQLARIAGADQVIAVDLIDERLAKATASGADVALNPKSTPDVARAIRELTGMRGPDVVIEVTGSTIALNEAIRSAAFQGRVVVPSFLAGEAKGLYLGEEFHHNRVRLISSQACAVNPTLHPRWHHERKMAAGMKFLPKLKLDHLVTHEFAFADAAKAFALLDRCPGDVLQVVLTY